MSGKDGKWAHLDLNQGPTGYEPVALTKLSYGPEGDFRLSEVLSSAPFWQRFAVHVSMKLLRRLLRLGCLSLRSALASI